MLGYKRIAGTITASDYHFPDKGHRFVAEMVMKAKTGRTEGVLFFRLDGKKQSVSILVFERQRPVQI